jgi:DNA-binding NtrC family response regulator
MRRDLLLIVADLRTRSLILAELQEAGYEVMAVPGLRYGLKAVLQGLVDPPAVVLDVHDDAFSTPERVRELMSLLPGVPLILIVGVYDVGAYEPLREGAAAFLVRPVTVGEITAAVRRVLPPPST